MRGKNDRKLGFAGLVGISAGSAVASGIFAFPGDFAAAGAEEPQRYSLAGL